MKTTRTCIHCHQTFLDIEGKVFANHVRWCPENKANGDKGSAKTSRGLKEFHENRLGKLIDAVIQCKHCKSNFFAKIREKKISQKTSGFCSIACANRHRGPRTEKQKQAIREKLSQPRVPRITRLCKICEKEFETTENRKKSFCSRSCGSRSRYLQDKTPLKDYRKKAAFSFNLADFPNEFDFSLIEKHGWYKAKNHGDNLNGVSRDHMVSVMFGFKHAVDPSIISHPANCRLVRHNDNVSKGRKCLITIDDLILRIKEWDEKYERL